MWPVAIVLIAVVAFYWFAGCITVIACLKAISHLCFGQFVRAALWFNVGTAMLLWWTDKWESWDHFLPGAAFFVGVGALGTCARFYTRHQRAVEAGSGPTPVVGLFNININLDASP